jgi:hypothetical protein
MRDKNQRIPQGYFGQPRFPIARAASDRHQSRPTLHHGGLSVAVYSSMGLLTRIRTEPWPGSYLLYRLSV